MKYEFPKVDLHFHLDGSIVPEVGWKIAQEEGVDLDIPTFEEYMKLTTVPPLCTDVFEYLAKFGPIVKLMQTKEHLTEITYTTIKRAAEQNLFYLEMRFAPQLHKEKGLSQRDAVEAVLEGVRKAAKDFPSIKVGVILCCMIELYDNHEENMETVRLTEEYLDEPIDFDNLVKKGSMMGSGGAIVMDEDNCMVNIAKFYMEFICDESCGKCTPCRIGTKRMLEILTRITDGKGTMEDLKELEELSQTVKSNSLCALGQTAANPINSTIAHFRDEYIAHIVDKKCPAHVCKNLMEYHIDPDKCIGCGMCARNCPASCITRTDYIAPGHKLASMHIDSSKCVKCGSCQSTCKFGAIEKR